jgi:hypothetical protein
LCARFSRLGRNSLAAIGIGTLKKIVLIVPLCRSEVLIGVLFTVLFL